MGIDRKHPPSCDFYPDDFIAGTVHMDATGIGIYVLMLLAQWSRGSAPADMGKLAKVCRCTVEDLQERWEEIGQKFACVDGVLVNDRLHKEYERKQKIRAQRRAAGIARWGGACETDASAYADAYASADASADASACAKTEFCICETDAYGKYITERSSVLSGGTQQEALALPKTPKRAQEKPKRARISAQKKQKFESTGSLELDAALTAWLAYKTERRESYTPTGLKRLVARVQKTVDEIGLPQVLELLDVAMAANWAGWDFRDRKTSGTKHGSNDPDDMIPF